MRKGLYNRLGTSELEQKDFLLAIRYSLEQIAEKVFILFIFVSVNGSRANLLLRPSLTYSLVDGPVFGVDQNPTKSENMLLCITDISQSLPFFILFSCEDIPLIIIIQCFCLFFVANFFLFFRGYNS